MFGFFQPRRELFVKVVHHGGPGDGAVFDFVEFLFHLGGKTDVEEFRQMADEKIADLVSQFCWQ